jgi:hypothetical protein
MDPTHLHLMLNHVPIVGIPIGLALLIFGLLLRSGQLRVASLLIFVFCAGIAAVVFLTGEPAEETVESLPGVSHLVIEAHEESAEVAIWGAVALGAVAALALALHIPRHLPSVGIRLRTVSLAAPLLLAAIVAVMLFRTANLGGQIRHTEIRSDAPAGSQDHASADPRAAADGVE